MKFTVTFRAYPAGIGQLGKDKSIDLEADSQEQAIDEFYSRPDFNPEFRVVKVTENAQNGTDKNGTLRAKTRTT